MVCLCGQEYGEKDIEEIAYITHHLMSKLDNDNAIVTDIGASCAALKVEAW